MVENYILDGVRSYVQLFRKRKVKEFEIIGRQISDQFARCVFSQAYNISGQLYVMVILQK